MKARLRKYVTATWVWLSVKVTAPRWSYAVAVVLTVLLLLLLGGCATAAPEAPITERWELHREAQFLKEHYGDRDDWPTDRRARWEESAERIR